MVVGANQETDDVRSGKSDEGDGTAEGGDHCREQSSND